MPQAILQFAPLVLDREFAAPRYGYPMAKAFKDMEVVREAALGVGEALPVLAAATRTYEEALALGLGVEHKGAMVKVVERKLGVEVRRESRTADS